MNILHIIAGLEKSAGTTVFVVECCNELFRQGFPCAILVEKQYHDDHLPIKDVAVYEGLSNLEKLPIPDVIHIHGLWSLFLHCAAYWGKKHKIPIVISPHGMLTSWALNHKKIKKIIAMACYQYWDLKRASMLHATAQSEIDDFRRLKLLQHTCVVPLGVEFPFYIESSPPMRLQNKKRTLLFISRVHPKKGLINLVDAWAQLKQVKSNGVCIKITEGWQVIIAGPSEENHADEVMAYSQQKGVIEDFQVLGAVYGSVKDELYRTANIFVLPSFSENFGSVVIEALAWGCPVITTKGTPWDELETEQCGKWIDIGVEPLMVALREMMSLSDNERHKMGENGRKLVERQYTWESVAGKMRNVYMGIVK